MITGTIDGNETKRFTRKIPRVEEEKRRERKRTINKQEKIKRVISKHNKCVIVYKSVRVQWAVGTSVISLRSANGPWEPRSSEEANEAF